MSNELTCDVCGKPAKGVCAAMGPMSCAFCQECLTEGRYPWYNITGYAMGLNRDNVADWFVRAIQPSLVFYEKTIDDFWEEVEKATASYMEEEINYERVRVTNCITCNKLIAKAKLTHGECPSCWSDTRAEMRLDLEERNRDFYV